MTKEQVNELWNAIYLAIRYTEWESTMSVIQHYREPMLTSDFLGYKIKNFGEYWEEKCKELMEEYTGYKPEFPQKVTDEISRRISDFDEKLKGE